MTLLSRERCKQLLCDEMLTSVPGFMDYLGLQFVMSYRLFLSCTVVRPGNYQGISLKSSRNLGETLMLLRDTLGVKEGEPFFQFSCLFGISRWSRNHGRVCGKIAYRT